MTLTIESPVEMVVYELKQFKQKGSIPQEILKECVPLILPKWVFVAFPFFGFSYLFMFLSHFFAKDMASAIASLGPMLTAFYISRYIQNKGK